MYCTFEDVLFATKPRLKMSARHTAHESYNPFLYDHCLPCPIILFYNTPISYQHSIIWGEGELSLGRVIRTWLAWDRRCGAAFLERSCSGAEFPRSL